MRNLFSRAEPEDQGLDTREVPDAGWSDDELRAPGAAVRSVPDGAVRPAGDSGRDRAAWDAVVDLFERAADTPHVAELVGRIGHTVSLRSLALPDEELIVVARDSRLEVHDTPPAGQQRTIELALATIDLERLGEGKLRAAMAIAGGRASFTGPVREFLRIVPIVQAIVNPPVAMGTNAAQDEEI